MEEYLKTINNFINASILYSDKIGITTSQHNKLRNALENILNELDRLQKENEELKNIISELEQYTLENQISEDSIDFNEFIEVQNMAFDEVYNKIQELLEEGE